MKFYFYSRLQPKNKYKLHLLPYLCHPDKIGIKSHLLICVTPSTVRAFYIGGFLMNTHVGATGYREEKKRRLPSRFPKRFRHHSLPNTVLQGRWTFNYYWAYYFNGCNGSHVVILSRTDEWLMTRCFQGDACFLFLFFHSYRLSPTIGHWIWKKKCPTSSKPIVRKCECIA